MGEPIATVGQLAGLCGHTGTAWQKLGMLWGYNNTVSESVANTNLGAGYQTLDGTAVPAGEVWVISAVGGFFVSATVTALVLIAMVNGVPVPIKSVLAPTGSFWHCETGQFVLREGDYVQLRLETCTAGDDGYLNYGGSKMKLDL